MYHALRISLGVAQLVARRRPAFRLVDLACATGVSPVSVLTASAAAVALWMELRLVGRTGVPPRRLLLSRIAFATTRLAILRCISCESARCLAISCATLYQRSRLYPYASSASIRYLRSHIESFIRLLPNALCSFVERDVSSPVVRDWFE